MLRVFKLRNTQRHFYVVAATVEQAIEACHFTVNDPSNLKVLGDATKSCLKYCPQLEAALVKRAEVGWQPDHWDVMLSDRSLYEFLDSLKAGNPDLATLHIQS